MPKVCPLCNSLKEEKYMCKKCRMMMIDKGRAQEVLEDDYSANMPINDTNEICIHIFRCEQCNINEKVQVRKNAI